MGDRQAAHSDGSHQLLSRERSVGHRAAEDVLQRMVCIELHGEYGHRSLEAGKMFCPAYKHAACHDSCTLDDSVHGKCTICRGEDRASFPLLPSRHLDLSQWE